MAIEGNLNLNGSWCDYNPTTTLQLQVKKQENKGEELAKFYVEAEASASDLTFVDQAK